MFKVLRKETDIPLLCRDTFSTVNKALWIAGRSFPAQADSKKQGTPSLHWVSLGQHLRNDHEYFYLSRSPLTLPPSRSEFASGLVRSLSQILKEDVGSAAMFLSTRPWERVVLDFQKSRCCFWKLWEEEMKSGTDSSPCRSLLQGKVGQDGEWREEVQLKLLPILFTAQPFCLCLVWGLVLQGKIPDALLIYVRVCWPDTVSWENRLETKRPDMSEQNGNDFTVNRVVLKRLIICSYFTECIKTLS